MSIRAVALLVLTAGLSGTLLQPAHGQIETDAPLPSRLLEQPDALFTPPTVHLTAPDEAVAATDAPFPTHDYGVTHSVSIDVTRRGRSHSMPDGGTLWRLAITSDQAQALRLRYEAFHLPPGAQLFVYDPDRHVVRGAFTARNNKPDRRFATDFTPGPRTIVEYYEPPDAAFSGRVRIGGVVHAQTLPPSMRRYASAKSTYEPSALPCSINTACPDTDGWDAQARATVLIDRGGSTCSGVLLNNERDDYTPYVLTAHHCGSPSVGETVDWIFRFNYASPTCTDPEQTPDAPSITGATVRVANTTQQSDVVLLELSDGIPPEYEVYFAGWDASGAAPSSAVLIGHPKSDIRKVTFEEDPPLDYSTRWIATFDQGTVEGGSSGSPLFNSSQRVIGHVSSALEFDPAECSGPGGDDNAPQISHPKLSYNWTIGTDGERLVDFLDPDGTGTTTLGGLEGSTGPSMPVELTAFDALRDGSDVVLQWTTASETNNAGFEVHHQGLDASRWSVDAFVSGHGTTQTAQHYRHRIAELPPGTHVFRLKQIDFDGTSSYSADVEVHIEGSPYALTEVAPHPIRHQSTFSLSVAQSQHVRVDLVDVLGRRVRTIHAGRMDAQNRRTFTIPARRLSSGVYLLRIAGETFATNRKVTVVR